VPFSFLVLAYVLVIYPLDRLIYLSKAMPSAYPVPDFPGVHNGFVVPLAVTLMSGLIGDLVSSLPPLAADRIAHPK
jgi:hypothetical protein